MSSIVALKKLYAQTSKHSNYQILGEKLTSIVGADQIKVKSRYEKERLAYILDKVDFEGKNILDIGGNSGFFTFEAIEHGAHDVHHYEGNAEHSLFVKNAAEALGCSDKLFTTNAYYTFEDNARKYNLVFLLNVLHHLGDDYGDKTLSIDAAKEKMAIQLNSVASITNLLVFQLGFNWKGDRNVCLFEQGTKKELIDFVKNITRPFWKIQHIGIPIKMDQKIIYSDLDSNNIARDDSLGEFLNRPLFIMKVK